MLIANPQNPHTLIEVCDDCGWPATPAPPVGDGLCMCFYPEHRAWWGRYGEYMADNLPRLRAVTRSQREA